jgi:hypothetical protein
MPTAAAMAVVERVEDNRRWQEMPGALKASVPDVWEMPTAHATSEAR